MMELIPSVTRTPYEPRHSRLVITMKQAAPEQLDALTISRLWNPTATIPLERSSSLPTLDLLS